MSSLIPRPFRGHSLVTHPHQNKKVSEFCSHDTCMSPAEPPKLSGAVYFFLTNGTRFNEMRSISSAEIHLEMGRLMSIAKLDECMYTHTALPSNSASHRTSC